MNKMTTDERSIHAIRECFDLFYGHWRLSYKSAVCKRLAEFRALLDMIEYNIRIGNVDMSYSYHLLGMHDEAKVKKLFVLPNKADKHEFIEKRDTCMSAFRYFRQRCGNEFESSVVVA